MPRYEFDETVIPDVLTLEELTEMSYQYVDEAERMYYTKWKRDLIDNAKKDGEKNGEKNASYRIARNLASMGMDIDKIVIATGLSNNDVKAALQTNSSLW